MNRSEQFYFLMYTITLLLVFSGTNVASSSNAGLFSETSDSDSTGQPTGNNFEEDFSQLTRIRYNNPGLTVDLGVGLWAVPFPVDYDEDGKIGRASCRERVGVWVVAVAGKES